MAAMDGGPIQSNRRGRWRDRPERIQDSARCEKGKQLCRDWPINCEPQAAILGHLIQMANAYQRHN